MRKREQKVPPSLWAQHHLQDRSLLSQGQSSSYNSGSQLNVRGEIPVLSGVSFDYTNLLTKPSMIKETPGDFIWNSNLGQLKTVSVPTINSKNCSSCVQNFNTHSTSLPKTITKSSPQNKNSKGKKFDFYKFYK